MIDLLFKKMKELGKNQALAVSIDNKPLSEYLYYKVEGISKHSLLCTPLDRVEDVVVQRRNEYCNVNVKYSNIKAVHIVEDHHLNEGIYTVKNTLHIGSYYQQKADVKATVSRQVMLVMLRNMSALSFTLTDNFLYRGRCSKRVYEMVSNTHKCIVTFQLTELSFIVTIRGNVFRDGYWTELNYVKVNTKDNEIF